MKGSMSIVAIKKPEVGTVVKSEADKYTGKIIRLVDFKLASAWMDRQTFREFSDEMEKRLGENFRDLYFEAYIQLEEVADDGRYQKNQIITLVWDEVQSLDFLAWESEK